MTIVYKEGYYEQTTYDEEHATLAALKRFGYPIDKKPILDIGITEDVVARNVYGQGYQSLEAGPQRADFITARFHPVNAKWLYWMLGKRTAATGTRTISNLDYTARKKFISVWKQTNDLKMHCYGTLFESCRFSMQQGNSPIVNLIGKGLSIGSDAYAPVIAWDGASLIKSRWDHIDSMSWDGDSLTPYAITMDLKQNTKPMPGYDGSNQDIDGQKPVFGTINAVCTAAQGEVAFVDWEASSPKTFEFTVGKSEEATHSMAGTFANARLMKVDKIEEFGISPIYNLLMMLQTTSFVVTDGI